MAIKRGFTLVEMLVVISLFSIIAVITTQSILRIIGSSSSASSSTKAREDVEYAMAVMERSIRNSSEVTCSTPPDRVDYVTPDGVSEWFVCRTTGSGSNIRTSINQAGRTLISNQVHLTTCSITCLTPAGATTPNAVQIVLEGVDRTGSYETEPVRLQTTISLRSY